jgi:hypothetical protein
VDERRFLFQSRVAFSCARRLPTWGHRPFGHRNRRSDVARNCCDQGTSAGAPIHREVTFLTEPTKRAASVSLPRRRCGRRGSEREDMGRNRAVRDADPPSDGTSVGSELHVTEWEGEWWGWRWTGGDGTIRQRTVFCLGQNNAGRLVARKGRRSTVPVEHRTGDVGS